METLVQAYLRAGNTLDDLLTTYGVTAKRHRTRSNLALLKYNQIVSPMHEPIVQECRGIILDEADDWRVVSFPFTKFFGVAESNAHQIDWLTARIQEKADGSLIHVYSYDGEWCAASSGTPDGAGDVHGLDASGTWEPRAGLRLPLPETFAAYFWQVFRLNYGAIDALELAPRDVCFFFELTGPLNRIVVLHQFANVTLLGARNLTTGKELTVAKAAALLGHTVRHVREFSLDTIDGIMASFASMSPLMQEGYVVVDGNFSRIKVKHPGYIALHHAKDGLSRRAFVEIARSGETPEVIAAFPELRPQLDDAIGRLSSLVSEVDADYSRLCDIPEQKAFAIEAMKTRCSSALFAVRSKKASDTRSFFAGVPIDTLMRWIGYQPEASPLARA